MVTWEKLVLFIGVTAVLAVTPGPDVIYVLTRGMAQGTKAALAAAFGFATGSLAHTAFAIVGISAILQASAVAFMVIKLVGAGYLIYLGLRALFDKSHFDISGKLEGKQIKQIYKQSVIANILNPKVAIFYLSFLPQFINQDSRAWTQLLELGAVFMVMTILVFGVIGVFAAKLGEQLKKNDKIAGSIRYVSGSVLCLLGIGLAIHDR
ncbi:Homoserine/homoserine lactone efflux protein [Poriferisphaera corsica]|uniref:Homoserine/homoserine lactone efflux protein n=1 Tax=Poriferisphaera corsica TaxID=2528020 RepID=A0A517YRA6_9BACT|nr:LysE family translocator [Poriferisphaera corsica]QDU32758.1 Homoserine/homoserine lactone efflux protein [Poriferisphaera corsica]